MRRTLYIMVRTAWVLLLLPYTSKAQNPIVQTIYTADPAPMVYKDTMFLYTGHDEDASTWFTMKDWHAYSTTDMVNWTDRGTPLSLKNFSWATSDAWAAQCIPRNGKFYWYICAKDKELNRMAIGVAVSDQPTGPFVDPIGKPLVSVGAGDIDPTVFIDDDGQAYLYWGNPDLWYVKLNEDMVSYDQRVGAVKVPLNKEGFSTRLNDPKRASAYEEGPWMYKRKELYYLLYPAGGVPEHLAYSTGSSATGPWIYRDTIMSVIKKGGAFTNHPGLVDYKGKSYLFYHNGALPGGGGFTRSVCVEEFKFNSDGSIPRITPGKGILNSAGNLNPYNRTEAETIAWGQGVKTSFADGPGVFVTNIENSDYIKVRDVNFGKGAKTFEASVLPLTGGSIEIRIDAPKGTLLTSCLIKKSEGLQNWTTVSSSVRKVKGIHDVYFIFKGNEGKLFDFDWWKFN